MKSKTKETKTDEVKLRGVYPETHRCADCGFDTAPGRPDRALAEVLLNLQGSSPMTLTWYDEMYMVRDTVWKAAGMEPWGGCLCVGCLEKRIGRKLGPKDFTKHEFNSPDIPASMRLCDRQGRPWRGV
jgi:hypothetical protein